jgi:hypothetical protein
MNDCRDAGVNFFFKGWGSLRFGRTLDGKEWDQLPWELYGGVYLHRGRALCEMDVVGN